MFIPIRDDNPCKTFPIVTVALIIINASIFLVSRKFNPFAAPSLHFSNFFSFMPIEFTGDLLRVGSPRPVWLSLFTSMFMHANLWHLIGNIWYLWLFGNRVEVRYGRTAFLTLYLMWGVTAASLHLLISSDPAVATVGASGAIAGVLGSYMLLFPKATIGGIWPLFYIFLPGELPAVIVLGQWFLLQLLAFQPGVAYLAHIGGFIAGMITALLFLAGSFILKRDMEGCTGSPYVEEIEEDSTVLPPKE